MFVLTNILLGIKMGIVSRTFKCNSERCSPVLDTVIHSTIANNSFLSGFLCFSSIIHILSRLMEAYGFNYQVYAEDMQSYSFFLTFLMKLVPNSNIGQIILLYYDIKHGPAEVWLIGNDTFSPRTAYLFSRKLI